MGGIFYDTETQDVGVDAEDCEDSIDRFCVMQEAFGEEGYVIEETFGNIYTFCC